MYAMRLCLCFSSDLRREVTAELVVETEAMIGQAAHLAIHDHDRRGVVIVVDEELVGKPLDVNDERVAVAAHEKADGLALLLFLAVPRRHHHELARRLQRLLDGAQHRAEERTMQFGDQHADGIGAARGQRLRDGIGLIAKLLHGIQHLLARLLADFRARVDDSRDRGQRDPGQFRDFIDVRHYSLCALQYCST